MTPVWLIENFVDVGLIYYFCLVSDGFYHASDTEVLGGSEVTLVDFVDEVDGFFGEGVVG